MSLTALRQVQIILNSFGFLDILDDFTGDLNFLFALLTYPTNQLLHPDYLDYIFSNSSGIF
jgi:hypothetical protein